MVAFRYVLNVVLVDNFVLVDANQFNGRFVDKLLGVDWIVSNVKIEDSKRFFRFRLGVGASANREKRTKYCGENRGTHDQWF